MSRAHRRCWNSVCFLLGLCTVRGDPATWWAGALLLWAAQGGQISMGWAGKAGVAQLELGAGIWSLRQIQRSVFRIGCTHPELRGRSTEVCTPWIHCFLGIGLALRVSASLCSPPKLCHLPWHTAPSRSQQCSPTCPFATSQKRSTPFPTPTSLS